MASFFGNLTKFGRQTPKPAAQPTPKSSNPALRSPPSQSSLQSPSSSFSAQSLNLPPTQPLEPPAITETSTQMANGSTQFFYREENSGLIVKGNFMTLAAKPEHVDTGDWLAHQVVEQYRLLEGMIKIIQEVDARTGLPICNPQTCRTMSAADFTYTWLDNNKNPVKIPAAQYIMLVQKWILGKVNDPKIFPTEAPNTQSSTPGASTPIAAGPTTINAPLSALAGKDWVGKSAGFPENFENDVKSLYRQMARIYAHLYHGHWLDPFYHLSATKELNTCFVHFVNVGKLFDLLQDKDLKPMQPLVDIWLAKGYLPIPQAALQSETVSAPA